MEKMKTVKSDLMARNITTTVDYEGKTGALKKIRIVNSYEYEKTWHSNVSSMPGYSLYLRHTIRIVIVLTQRA